MKAKKKKNDPTNNIDILIFFIFLLLPRDLVGSRHPSCYSSRRTWSQRWSRFEWYFFYVPFSFFFSLSLSLSPLVHHRLMISMEHGDPGKVANSNCQETKSAQIFSLTTQWIDSWYATLAVSTVFPFFLGWVIFWNWFILRYGWRKIKLDIETCSTHIHEKKKKKKR